MCITDSLWIVPPKLTIPAWHAQESNLREGNIIIEMLKESKG